MYPYWINELRVKVGFFAISLYDILLQQGRTNRFQGFYNSLELPIIVDEAVETSIEKKPLAMLSFRIFWTVLSWERGFPPAPPLQNLLHTVSMEDPRCIIITPVTSPPRHRHTQDIWGPNLTIQMINNTSLSRRIVTSSDQYLRDRSMLYKLIRLWVPVSLISLCLSVWAINAMGFITACLGWLQAVKVAGVHLITLNQSPGVPHPPPPPSKFPSISMSQVGSTLPWPLTLFTDQKVVNYSFKNYIQFSDYQASDKAYWFIYTGKTNEIQMKLNLTFRIRYSYIVLVLYALYPGRKNIWNCDTS